MACAESECFLNEDSNDPAKNSDEDVPETHANLLNAVSQLYRKQRITVPKRSEATKQISEFNLSNNAFNDGPLVKVQDLFQPLKQKASFSQIKNLLIKSHRQAKALPKPVEQLVTDRLKRHSGYKSVKKQLSRWDAIIQRNRAAEQLIFPLKNEDPIETPLFVKPDNFLSDFKEPTELERKLAEVLCGSDVVRQEVEEKEAFAKMSVKELLERRQMMAKMRARESYRIAKAVRQNKIKSKKYHRILKRERIKKELKEFELLQKTNPEAAAEKLEYLERARAEERISLRHKNTGKWARGLAIRAKYDREARVQLSEQLSKSKELTRKLQSVESNSEEEAEEEVMEDDECAKPEDSGSNPWVRKQENEFNSFVEDFKLFRGKQTKINDEPKRLNSSGSENPENSFPNSSAIRKSESPSEKTGPPEVPESESINVEDDSVNSEKSPEKPVSKTKKTKIASKCGSWAVLESAPKRVAKPNNAKDVERKLDVLFDKAVEVLGDKMCEAEGKVQCRQSLPKKQRNKPRRAKKKRSSDLSFNKNSQKVAQVDLALIEDTREGISSGENLAAPMDVGVVRDDQISEKKLPDIDPQKHLPVKIKKISTEMPDVDNGGDSEEEDSERMNLMEAFADDNVADEFSKEKEELLNESKAKKIDLSLPGWGHWAGQGLEKQSKRKRRRLILKVPQVTRKDAKKSKVIIRDEPSAKLQEHCVNDLPHPFTSVRDFENSLRAPIGDNWVMQKAHDKLVAPPVITKKGRIITPMDEKQLIKLKSNRHKRKPQNAPVKNKL